MTVLRQEKGIGDQMLRPIFIMAALCVAPAVAIAAPKITPKTAPKTAIEKDGEACSKDPRYHVGGAAIGDCLQALSDAVDLDIAAEVAAGVTRYAVAADRDDYLQAHDDWQAYRKRICDLVERSPGNTPSWVNGAACRLELGRQRVEALRYTRDYGTARAESGTGDQAK